MPTFAFNGENTWNLAGYVLDGGNIECAIAIPAGGYVANNGQNLVLITGLHPFWSARGSACSASAQVGSQGTVGFTLPVGTSGTQLGLGLSAIFDAPTTQVLQLNFSGAINFGHIAHSGVNIAGNYSESNSTIGGYFDYAYVPGPCNIGAMVVTSTSGQLNMNFGGPSDNGGSGILNYRVQYATNSAFTTGVGNITTASGSQPVTGLTPGTTYWFRVAANNGVTNAIGVQGPWTGAVSAVAPGVPGAPTSLTATASTSAVDTIGLSWTAPANTGGGITGYNIYSSGTKIGSTTGTGLTYTASGLTDNTSYTFTVRARNAYADSTSTASVDSNTATATSPGVPSVVQSVLATANVSIAGEIDLTWVAPVTAGTGGITSYAVYFSTGTLITSVSGSTLAYSVTGLTPGTSYGFYVLALNAIAVAAGTASAQSNISRATAVGQPPIPTGCTATANTLVANRLVLAWTGAAGDTGFNIYEVIAGVNTFVGTTTATTFSIDNLSTAVHTYVINARNAVTDATVPVSQGPASAAFSGTPGTSSSQTVPSLSVTDVTNGIYNGSFVVSGGAGTALSYAKTNANLASTTSSAGTVTDTTSATLSGTYSIASIPTTTSITYALTSADVPTTPVFNGTITDNTNILFNGTKTVTAVNNTTGTVSYALTTANIASVATTGTITDSSNVIYNGTGVTIIATPTANSLTYAKTNANIALTQSNGTITDTTNTAIYNGNFVVTSIPSYNSFTYAQTHANVALQNLETPFGVAFRATSRAELEIQYRSGWAG